MKKIPYGISNFKLLKEEDYFFIDKTDYIPKLEAYGSRYLIFLRPRRFGKSLWIAILEAYYDLYFKDEFNTIFKDTYILNHKTKEASSYLVLRFDFSAIDIYDVEKSFRYVLQLKLESFVERYNLDIKFKNDNPISMFNKIFDYILKRQLKLYILIDEYDNFANKLLLNNKEDYLNIVSKKTASFKQFFTTLKVGTSGNDAPIKRMFITGVTPMTMYDVTSGFNIGENISLNNRFHNLIGLNSDELDHTLKAFDIEDKVDIALLQEWYNNYIFSEDSTEAIYNTDMILYFINKFLSNYKLPREMIDINVRSDYSKLRTIIYTNKKLNGNFKTLQTLIGGETVSIANLVQDFSALNLQKENNFKSFMFYLGLVTIKDRQLKLNLKIPNETVKRIDIDFLIDALELEKVFEINIDKLSDLLAEFALHGDLEIFKYLAKMIKENTGIRDYIYNEQTVKSMFLAYLSLTPYYVIKSENELNKGFADILLKPFNPYVEFVGLLEFKYIKRGKKKPTQKEIDILVHKAQNQLDDYQKDELVQNYIEQGLKLQKVVLVFWGWEMVYCYTHKNGVA
ncbi:AAA family ATPase [Sulfurovum sp. bin170]|uniref:AAA family ATPase n=1 Tax=Sulfurovum sp. bin170 TaxID=2695268 RepID=UPI0013DE8B9C|nr:AAA family ATPase [Sulfurovum sp. bin170]NEW59850.1 AAA family ATPase [Sulfurovum sp. bin170]